MNNVQYYLCVANYLKTTLVVRKEEFSGIAPLSIIYRCDYYGEIKPGIRGIDWKKSRGGLMGMDYTDPDKFMLDRIVIPTKNYEGTTPFFEIFRGDNLQPLPNTRGWVIYKKDLLPHRYFEQVHAFSEMMHKKY